MEDIKTLLSLPPNLIDNFYELENVKRDKWFCTSDPVNVKLGSGGGSSWLLKACKQNDNADDLSFSEWLAREKRILLHAGGQSRRLPAYAPSGKILTPVPVFDWERGQKLNQNLLSLQLPLYKKIMKIAPSHFHTLIASGDVYIRAEQPLQSIPNVDVVCYGLWANASLATHHGVFVMKRTNEKILDYMIQKPTVEELESISQTHIYLMDIGVWLLSDRAVQLLYNHSLKEGKIAFYDMYSEYGLSLGVTPKIKDKDLNTLSVAILPLPGGEFYHYGTSKELLSSTLAIQNKIQDQRIIMHRKVKSNPATFVMNSLRSTELTENNSNIWIENSCVGKKWKLESSQIITGIPKNDWDIHLPNNICLDVIPVGEAGFVARPYGFDNIFKGSINDKKTEYLKSSFTDWLQQRNISIEEVAQNDKEDIQNTKIFPLTESISELEFLIKWMISMPEMKSGKEIWLRCEKLSANDLSNKANLKRLFAQREDYRKENLIALADNQEKSVFYQLDLVDTAQEFVRLNLNMPNVLDTKNTQMKRIHNRMLRARILKILGSGKYKVEQTEAFNLLREGLLKELDNSKTLHPHLNIYSDQIVWGRCPVRIDLAGGWTDTPPYSLYSGGNVVNIAIELNGQPPLQVYVKPCKEPHIVLRSIDMGAMEVISTFQELYDYNKIGSPFSIPKAGLVLSGFGSLFSHEKYNSLENQLRDFGSGIEITLLAAIPAGSGLGTSSILASTVLGAINDFCGLEWDKTEICKRTLLLEQLLTSGGGWQDQYGGVLEGVKLLQSEPGFSQQPLARWLPDILFTSVDYRDCHLLYYTGITRIAKDILSEIVCSMFLNSSKHLHLLNEMKEHAINMSEAIQRNDYEEYGKLVLETWEQNKLLDNGTNPPAIENIIKLIKDYTIGYKLPGAGGGGYLYMIAKDPQAAQCIKKILLEQTPNSRARFVSMSLSNKGFQVSRS